MGSDDGVRDVLSGASMAGLLIFASVARHMNFARAADEMGVTPTAISRTVKVLESQMNVRLFNRTTRSVALTQAGAQLLRTLAPALEQIGHAISQASQSTAQPTGLLRINSSYVAYAIAVRPYLRGFLDAFSDVQVELAFDNQLSDVIGAGFDAGIRLGHALQRDMIAVLLSAPQRRTVLAAPGYLSVKGAPKRPADLLQHDCIRQRFAASDRYFDWRFMDGGKAVTLDVRGRLVFNEMRAVVDTCVDGDGLGYVFEALAERELASGLLVPLLERYRVPDEAFYLYYPGRAQMPGKLRAFIDYIQEHARR